MTEDEKIEKDWLPC